jgi:UDP-glucose 4-epimerase
MKMLTGKKAVVTGSSGFIGKILTRRLWQEHAEVIELDIENGIDVTDWEIIRHIGDYDVLFHLAAKTYVPDSYRRSHEFYYANIISTLNMLELCRLKNALMIFASSYVYGQPQYLPIDERHPVMGCNPYAQSKIICENLCEGYHRDHHTSVIICRQANIYGIGQSEHFLIPKIFKQAFRGKIRLFDPRPKRDFIYVDDLVDAYIKCACYDLSQFEIFNIGYGISYSISEVINHFRKLFHNPIEVSFTGESRPNEIMDSVFNIEKAKKLLKWKPAIPIETGLRKIFVAEKDKQKYVIKRQKYAQEIERLDITSQVSIK